MKCPYCAEQIEEQAVLCRFCGARRTGSAWRAPGETADRAKTNFTIASTGWLLLLSGAWSLFTLTSPVALFGSLRGGLVAALYNAVFAALFLAMGHALVWRKPWALSATWITSAVYTLDKLELIADRSARDAVLGEASSLLGDLGPMVQQVMILTSLLFLFGWWAFAAYLYRRREYFGAR